MKPYDMPRNLHGTKCSYCGAVRLDDRPAPGRELSGQVVVVRDGDQVIIVPKQGGTL